MKLFFINPISMLFLTMALFVGFVPFSNAQHADIWLTLIDNQVTASEINSETNVPIYIDLTTGRALFKSVFGTFNDPNKTDQPGYQSLTDTFNPDDYLYYRAVGSLLFWDGDKWVNEVPNQERVKIRDVIYSYSFISDTGVTNPLGAIAQFNENGSLHQHIDFFIENQAGSDPAVGAYIIDMEYFGTNTPGSTIETHLASEPIRIVFNYQMSDADFNEAFNALTSPPEQVEATVPFPYGALFILAAVMFLFSFYERRRKTIVR